jgi:hypothetical protein
VAATRGKTGKFLAAGCLVGFAGIAMTFLFSSPERFWLNWIVWSLFLLTTGLGCLFIVALEHVVGARWSIPLRRIPERLSGLTLMMIPAVLIALASLNYLYPWTDPEVLENPIVGGKEVWLNVPFFIARVVACIALWALSYLIFVRGSIRQDRHGDPRFNLRVRRFAPLFMFMFAITLTVVAFDWISSLEPIWYSDIFGVYLFTGSFLAGLAATTLAVLYLKTRGRLPAVRADHIYNLGGFLFAFIVFWSYIGFAQYMLMWYANIPEEVFWYQARLSGGWGLLLIALAFFHFIVPFFVLMARNAKSDPRFLSIAALLVLSSHLLDLYWMIFPTLEGPYVIGWQELSFALLFIAVALLWIKRSMKHGEDMPVGDPMLREGLEFRL